MSLVKPAAPPGVMSQATQVQARGAWFAGNLVRWRTGLLEKMGGWKRLIEDALGTTVRRMHAWLDTETFRRNLLIATDGGNLYLKVQETLYPLVRQSPLPPGNPQTSAWFLANFGKYGLALASRGPLELYTPPIETGTTLTNVGAGAVPTAPQKSNGMLVAMPQAQVILWGTEASTKEADGTIHFGTGVIDPLLINWSDVGSYDKYIATATNQAGTYRLSRGSRIVSVIQAPQATLILTDTDLWQMSYIGPPLIYGFTIMGSGCGAVSPHAIGTNGRITVWQGVKNFWMFDTGVQPVQCTVWDYIFEDLDVLNINKCHAAPNATTTEIGFYFPSRTTALTDLPTNLLLQSQELTDALWVGHAAGVGRFVAFTNKYIYEEGLLQMGWLDPAGIVPISWFDEDVQGVLATSELITAPDGSGAVFNLLETAVNDTHSISQSILKLGERTVYTLSIYAHDSSTRNLTLRAEAKSGGDSVYVTFDVVAGNVVAFGSSPKFSLLGRQVLTDRLGTGRTDPTNPNGWRRYVMTFASDDSPTMSVFFNITNGTTLSYLGVPPNGVRIWGAQLVLGGEPLDYEPTGQVAKQNETRRYVKVNTSEGMAWDSGELTRTAWLDQSIWGMPLGADQDNVIQQHEIGFDDDGKPMRGVFAETGFTELGDGTVLMLVDQCHPDMKWFGRNGGVDISLRATNYPQGPQHLYGPFPITPGTQWFNPRVRARYVAVRYEWLPELGFSSRVGAMTFNVKPAGRLP